MVVDIDVLRRALSAVTEAVAGTDLNEVLDTDDAVTVERLAGWMHRRLVGELGPLGGADVTVRVWEGPERLPSEAELRAPAAWVARLEALAA